jgi:hypothetical protein
MVWCSVIAQGQLNLYLSLPFYSQLINWNFDLDILKEKYNTDFHDEN